MLPGWSKRFFLVAVIILLPGCLGLELCDYFAIIGRRHPDCVDDIDDSFLPPDELPEASFTPMISSSSSSSLRAMPRLPPTPDYHLEVQSELEEQNTEFERIKAKIPMCNGPTYKHCHKDLNCPSEISCEYRPDRRCCLGTAQNVVAPRILTECPETKDMNIQCAVRNPTSWCETDNDCSRTPIRMCCPTGCGYNVCIQSQGYVIDNGIHVIENPNCPLSELIEIRCEKRKATNWCNADEDCLLPGPGSHFGINRHCCPTVCNYNACVTNYGGHFVIG